MDTAENKSRPTRRRDFLDNIIHIIWGAIIFIFLFMYKRFVKSSVPSPEIRQIPIDQINRGLNVYNEFFILKNETGMQIISRRCPHLGCTVQADRESGLLKCPCHGSTFHINGNYISGPAKKSLEILSAKIDDKKLINIRL